MQDTPSSAWGTWGWRLPSALVLKEPTLSKGGRQDMKWVLEGSRTPPGQHCVLHIGMVMFLELGEGLWAKKRKVEWHSKGSEFTYGQSRSRASPQREAQCVFRKEQVLLSSWITGHVWRKREGKMEMISVGNLQRVLKNAEHRDCTKSL